MYLSISVYQWLKFRRTKQCTGCKKHSIQWHIRYAPACQQKVGPKVDRTPDLGKWVNFSATLSQLSYRAYTRVRQLYSLYLCELTYQLTCSGAAPLLGGSSCHWAMSVNNGYQSHSGLMWFKFDYPIEPRCHGVYNIVPTFPCNFSFACLNNMSILVWSCDLQVLSPMLKSKCRKVVSFKGSERVSTWSCIILELERNVCIIYKTYVATCPCQTIRDGVEGEGLRVLESRRSRMTHGTWRRLTVCVHKVLGGEMYGLARKDPASRSYGTGGDLSCKDWSLRSEEVKVQWWYIWSLGKDPTMAFGWVYIVL